MQKILCFGDSNTFGYDPRIGIGSRYSNELRWTGRLRAGGWEVMNRGLNGRQIPTLPNELDALGKILSTHTFHIIIVMLGGNDLLYHPEFTAENVTERMENLFRFIAERAPTAKLLLLSPPYLQFGTWVQEERLITESIRLASCYEALAKKLDIVFADTGKWGIALSYDGVHFLPEGHATFARCLEKVLKENF